MFSFMRTSSSSAQRRREAARRDGIAGGGRHLAEKAAATADGDQVRDETALMYVRLLLQIGSAAERPSIRASAVLPIVCPNEGAGYCRGWNLVHQQSCKYAHRRVVLPPSGPAEPRARLIRLVSGTPSHDYVKMRFVNSWDARLGRPRVSGVWQVEAPELEGRFEDRRAAIQAECGGVKPTVTELYHGTCEALFDAIFANGFGPPADYGIDSRCPVSGPWHGKLSTSLCGTSCGLCTATPRHRWNMCHMWGLGVYCATRSSKSDMYVSNWAGSKTARSKRKMLVCSVILGNAETVEKLAAPDSMHERVFPAIGKHSIYAVGRKSPDGQTQFKVSVVNDEYVVFHAHQMMPLYVVQYSR